MDKVKIITKTIEKMIEMEWLTVNKHLKIEALAHFIETDLDDAAREYKKSQEIAEMLNAMQKYYPKGFQAFFEDKEK